MTNERPKSLNTVGLQIDGSLLKAVHLEKKKGKIHLIDLYSIDISSETVADNVNPLSLTDRGKQLARDLKTHLSLSAVESSETLVRPLFVQLKKDKDIAAVIGFQSEPILPYSSDEAVIDWLKVGQEENGSHLSVYAVKKDHVQRHLDEWNGYGIDPENVSVVPVAMTAFTNYFVTSDTSYFAVHIGNETTTCGLVVEGQLLGAQSFHKGVNDLVVALEKDSATSIYDVDFMNISDKDFPHLFNGVDQFKLEIMKNLLSLTKLLKGKELEKIVFTGIGATLLKFNDKLCQSLKKQQITFEVPSEFSCDRSTLLKYDIAIGLALSGIPGIKTQVDLRQQELSYPNPWKRILKPVALYLVACFLLAWGAYMSGMASSRYKEDTLKEKFGSLLALMDKPYKSFEEEFESSQGETSGLTIEELDVNDLFDRLDYLNEEVDKAPEPIALMPNTPRVSDILAWLATHPNVVLAGDEKGLRKPLIKIDSFNYNMMKRPEEKKRNNKYQVKVELEFTSPTPKLAREFHDALIEGNDFVDTKGEVKWSSNRGRYRTSFYLKDKTYYPVSTKR
ncbi:MAG: hypothetical protein VX777_09435 [Chlamydiota bacterium]|nr:hypothetical protein [Chlamydiota bacterium]